MSLEYEVVKRGTSNFVHKFILLPSGLDYSVLNEDKQILNSN